MASKNGFEQLTEILTEIEGEAATTLEAGCKEATDEIAQEIRNKALSLWPGSDYPKNWTVSKEKGSYIVHNKKTYRLAHLLNNGHRIIKNGRVVGSAKAKPHILSQEEADKVTTEIIERRLNQL